MAGEAHEVDSENHLSCRKDMTLFAPIVPPLTETVKLSPRSHASNGNRQPVKLEEWLRVCPAFEMLFEM